MDELKLFDVEFASVERYSGRSICQAHNRDEAQEITKKALEAEGFITTSGDVYDILELEPDDESGSLLLGVKDHQLGD